MRKAEPGVECGSNPQVYKSLCDKFKDGEELKRHSYLSRIEVRVCHALVLLPIPSGASRRMDQQYSYPAEHSDHSPVKKPGRGLLMSCLNAPSADPLLHSTIALPPHVKREQIYQLAALSPVKPASSE
jgi:hypothetical protein